MLDAGELDLPLPGGGDTAGRWRRLAGWGGHDLSCARLAEGHVDAVAILAEAGRAPRPGALYGVWAARPGGAGAALHLDGGRRELRGTVRYCSGARSLDRALVVAGLPGGEETVLVDVAVAGAPADPDSWRTPAMAGADTLDVRLDGVPVEPGADVGAPGWYVARPGFAVGGGGVAAVWWGGAAGILRRLAAHGSAAPEPHRDAHVGELHAVVESAGALLERTAAAVDADPGGDHRVAVSTLRSAVEHAVREVVDRVPRAGGVGPLSGDPALSGALADLAVYVRQHHGERDHAALGAQVRAGLRAGR
jgi:hypothetical protein